MYQQFNIMYMSFLILILANLLNLTMAIPIESKTSYYNKAFESSSSDISETVSKILRLMHSLSNKSILVSPSTSSNNLATAQSNLNLNEVKRENENSKLKSIVVETRSDSELANQIKDRLTNKFNHKKMMNKLINERFNKETNDRSNLNERFNDNFNEEISNDNLNENNDNNDNNLDKLREKSINSPIMREYILSTKYPTSDNDQEQKKVATNSETYFRTNPTNSVFKLNEMIKSNDDQDETPKLNIPAFLKQFNRFNGPIDVENLETRDSSKLTNEKETIERFDLQSTKDHKKNLYDMVENEEEDNLGEEEHNMHNYNISLLSDRELNRTLIDIQWLLNQNLSKQDMESKFSSKGRNNRNKIAQRMEYFEKLYRNIHQLNNNSPTTTKRGDGPQLSVVSPLDILRDKLILEIARRKIEQSKSQMKENEDYLKKIG